MQTELLKVTGMTCGGCTTKITKALKAIPGVGDVEVSFAAGEAKVHYDDSIASIDQLKVAIKGAGYGVDGIPGQAKRGCCG